MKTYEILFTGQVQGVGFRFHVQECSRHLPVYGTVRNLSDGRVKVIAQGDQASIREFIRLIKIPRHRMMKIKQVEVHEIELAKQYHDFRIIY
ncbi:acylphosphatase [Hutsoniella sourekii]